MQYRVFRGVARDCRDRVGIPVVRVYGSYGRYDGERTFRVEGRESGLPVGSGVEVDAGSGRDFHPELVGLARLSLSVGRSCKRVSPEVSGVCNGVVIPVRLLVQVGYRDVVLERA